MSWPTGMQHPTPRNAMALETALTWVCITYDTAPPVRRKEESFMNSLPPQLMVGRSFKQNLADVQAMLDAQPERVRDAFLSCYFATLVTR